MVEKNPTSLPAIAIVGGTGKEGKGLAYRWIKAGYQVTIGSRMAEKAQTAAEDLRLLLGYSAGHRIIGTTNLEAAKTADIIVVTIPYSAHRETFESLRVVAQGKLVVDVTVPLVPPKVSKVQMPPAGSAAMEAHQILGDGIELASAFQNIAYDHLLRDEPIECDVLVCGSSKNARTAVLELVKAAGLVGWDAGPLDNSVVVEGLTSLLIGINRQFDVQSAGIRITGVPR